MSSYLNALSAHDPNKAPVAKSVIFSENGVIQPIGEAMWLTAGKRGSYWLPITDPAAGEAAVFTMIEERGDPELFALRIKVENRLITEAEQMLVRPSGQAFKPIVQDRPDPRLLAPVPPEERVGRDELIRIANSYFEGIDTPLGASTADSALTPFWDDCQRRENGSITASNPDPKASAMAKLGCKQQFATGFQIIVTAVRDRRILVADTERQLVFAFGFFDHAGVGDPKMTTGTFSKPFSFELAEAFKVRQGKIQQVEAILYSVPYRMRTDFDRLSEARKSGATPSPP
jgi:hypothetical protein